jgi:hypothetical protein
MIWLSATTPGHADGSPMHFELGTIMPTLEATVDAHERAGGEHCKTRECVAIATIIITSNIIFLSQETATWIGMPTPEGEAIVKAATRPSVIKRQLRTALLNHPERFPAICQRITSFASLYEQAGTVTGQDIFLGQLIQMALLMDVRSHGDCLTRVLAAFPETDDAKDLINRSRGFCQGAQWASAACKRIAR